MTFRPIKPGTQRRADPVCVSLTRRYNHGNPTVVFEMSLSTALCADLKWKPGDNFEVAVGEGPDAGYLRVRPAEGERGGYMLRQACNASKRLRLRVNYWGPDERFRMAPCKARPDTIGRTLTIEIPWQPRVVRAA